MWHEARKQEKKIRSLMVDYRKRADRRREFYQKIKLDPAQFLRIYGRPAKIHLESAVAVAAESPQTMMPWQGDSTISIDRFDARAHLDYIPEIKSSEEEDNEQFNEEDRMTNYERYRILVQNECAHLSEEQCLQQIFIDEMFGAQDIRAKEKEKEAEKKKLSASKAAIGYSYADTENGDEKKKKAEGAVSDAESEDSVDSDIDLDNVFDVNKLTTEQTNSLNDGAVPYGMKEEDFFSCMWKDKEEAEELRLAKIMEEEKAQYSGRKSRRERRAYKEKKLKERGSLSPPSYAAKRQSPTYEPYRKSSSRSRSPSPKVSRKKTFIMSYGGSDDEAAVQGPQLPPHLQLKSATSVVSHNRKSPSPPMFKEIGPRVAVFKAISKKRLSTSMSRSRSRSKSPKRKRFSYSSSSRSRSRSRKRSRSRNRSKTRNKSRSKSRSRSRKRSRSWKRRSYSSSSSRSRSGSRSRSRSGRRSRSGSRSRSRSSRSGSRDSGIKALPQFRRRTRSVSSMSSSSRSSSGSDDDKSPRLNRSSGGVDYGKKSSTAASKSGKMSIQERMKKKMKKALNIQYKADKKARLQKQEKEEQDRLEREEELRIMAIELRRKEREKRHLEMEDLERMEADEKSRRRSRSTSKSKSTRKRSASKSRSPRSPATQRASSRSRRSHSSSRKVTKTTSSDERSERSRGSERLSERVDSDHNRSSDRGAPYSGRPSESRGEYRSSDRGEYRSSDRGGDYNRSSGSSSGRAQLRLTHSGEYKYMDDREHRYSDRGHADHQSRNNTSTSRHSGDYYNRSSSSGVGGGGGNHRSSSSSYGEHHHERGQRDSGRSSDHYSNYSDRSSGNVDRKRSYKLVDY